MPRLESFVICESAALDSTTKRVSYFHVFDADVERGEFPWQIPQITAVSRWKAESMEQVGLVYHANLGILLPGDSREKFFHHPFILDAEGTRAIQKIFKIPAIAGPGTMTFRMYLENDPSRHHNLVAEYAVSISDPISALRG